MLSLLVIVMLNVCNSCSRNALSKSKMIKILTEIHTLEGALEASGINYIDDKEPYFNAIFAKYNISRAEFDSALVWYTAKPRQFERIYNAVTENLKNLETDVKNRKYHPIDYEALRNSKSELWKHAESIIITHDTLLTNASFVVKDTTLRWKDIYHLSFIERVSPIDSIQNLYAVMRIHYHTGFIDSIRIDLKPDSIKRRYMFKLPAKEKSKIDSLTANLFVFDYIKTDSIVTDSIVKKYKTQIDSIKLIRNYNALIQDSIGKIINEMDTISVDTITLQKK